MVSLLLFAAVFLFVPTGASALFGLGHHRAVPAAQFTGHGPHRWMQHQPGLPDEPVRWNPCATIHYVINPVGGPAGAVPMIRSAVAEVQVVSGLRFAYAGLTSQRPDPEGRTRVAGGQLLIAFASPREVPRLAGDVAGLGGSSAVDPGEGRRQYVEGRITLDEGSFARLEHSLGGHAEQRAIVLHELGHVVGLAHVADRNQLMASENVGGTDFADGDLQGLAVLGQGPCG